MYEKKTTGSGRRSPAQDLVCVRLSAAASLPRLLSRLHETATSSVTEGQPLSATVAASTLRSRCPSGVESAVRYDTNWGSLRLHGAGWTAEAQGTARHGRANTADPRTHALGRLGRWALERHDVVWRTIVRAVNPFWQTIPAITAVPMLT